MCHSVVLNFLKGCKICVSFQCPSSNCVYKSIESSFIRSRSLLRLRPKLKCPSLIINCAVNVKKRHSNQVAESRPVSEPAADGVKKNQTKPSRFIGFLSGWLLQALSRVLIPELQPHSLLFIHHRRLWLPFTSMIGLVVAAHRVGPFHWGETLQTCIPT